MSDPRADFLVVGATPLARLLAGLLAGTHGRRVAFVGESQSGYRLPRGIDLSVAPVTRPESWALVAQALPETLRLIGRIAGRGAWSHVDPIFFADTVGGREALSHIRQMAAGFGIAAERVAPSMLGRGRDGVVLRDAVRLNRPVLEAALDAWLDRQGVQRLPPEGLAIGMDGSAAPAHSPEAPLARQAVLADDAAIMALLPLRQWPTLLRRQRAATILTTPTRPIAGPVMLQIDTGTMLLQQEEGGIAAMGPGDMARFSAGLQLLLGQERQVQQAGQTAYQRLETLDGAPAVGRAAGTGADILAGLGPTGAFLAPVLARWLAGAATPQEEGWLGARLVNRPGTPSPAADYRPAIPDMAA